MNDYLDDLLVWGIILAILAPIFIALFKRKRRVLIFIVGAFLLLGAVPAAYMSEISINGCCGAPTSDNEGVGYLIGGGMAVVGILIIIFNKKTDRQ